MYFRLLFGEAKLKKHSFVLVINKFEENLAKAVSNSAEYSKLPLFKVAYLKLLFFLRCFKVILSDNLISAESTDADIEKSILLFGKIKLLLYEPTVFNFYLECSIKRMGSYCISQLERERVRSLVAAISDVFELNPSFILLTDNVIENSATRFSCSSSQKSQKKKLSNYQIQSIESLNFSKSINKTQASKGANELTINLKKKEKSSTSYFGSTIENDVSKKQETQVCSSSFNSSLDKLKLLTRKIQQEVQVVKPLISDEDLKSKTTYSKQKSLINKIKNADTSSSQSNTSSQGNVFNLELDFKDERKIQSNNVKLTEEVKAGSGINQMLLRGGPRFQVKRKKAKTSKKSRSLKKSDALTVLIGEGASISADKPGQSKGLRKQSHSMETLGLTTKFKDFVNAKFYRRKNQSHLDDKKDECASDKVKDQIEGMEDNEDEIDDDEILVRSTPSRNDLCVSELVKPKETTISKARGSLIALYYQKPSLH